MLSDVLAKVLGNDCIKEIPKKFVKWVGVYLETIAMDPELCNCVEDSECASKLDEMLLELLNLDGYEVNIDENIIERISSICKYLGA